MSLTLSKSSFENMPAGTHPARCYQIIDIGTQKTEYKGEVKYLSKVILSFETPEEKMEDGKPFIIHQEYTASMGEKANLRQHLESWRGQVFTPEELSGFFIGNLLTQPSLITVMQKVSGSGNTYSKITNISKPLKGMVVPELFNPTLKWEMGGDLDVLPEWIKNKVLASMEMKTPATLVNTEDPSDGLTDADTDFNDDLPPF